MSLVLANMYQYGITRSCNWKKANVGPLVIFIVAMLILGILGLGVVAYCVYKGMSFEFAIQLNPWTMKIACRAG